MRKLSILVLLPLLVLFACKGKESSSNEFKPVSEEECKEIQGKLEAALSTKFDMTSEKSSDYPKGSVCLLEAKGTGVNFEMMKTSDTIQKTIGWESDIQYAADGPTGTQSSLKKDKKVLVYNVGWEEASDAKCPDDKPISDCEIPPEKQNYTVTVSIGTL